MKEKWGVERKKKVIKKFREMEKKNLSRRQKESIKWYMQNVDHGTQKR